MENCLFAKTVEMIDCGTVMSEIDDWKWWNSKKRSERDAFADEDETSRLIRRFESGDLERKSNLDMDANRQTGN